MGLQTDFNGNVISSSTPDSLWSNKGGIFTSYKGIKSYFPLPMFYRTQIPTIGSFIVTTEYQYRADLLARKLYGSEDYWWLIFWMSGIIDPFSGPKTGDIILIADINKLNSFFG